LQLGHAETHAPLRLVVCLVCRPQMLMTSRRLQLQGRETQESAVFAPAEIRSVLKYARTYGRVAGLGCAGA